MNQRHRPRTIIITGANGNIGSALAADLLSEGNHLILISHRETDRITQLVSENLSSVYSFASDIRDFSGLEQKLHKALSETGWQPEALLHTAALRSIDFSPLSQTDPNLWKEIIDTNINGTFNVLKATINLFLREEQTVSGYRRIVLFGSDVSRLGLPYGSAYAASKAAIANLCRSLSVELGEHKILVNTLSPGPIEIDDSHFSEEYREFRREYYREQLARIPLSRLAKPADAISLCKFLISDQNEYLSGEEIFLTGGKL
jgi:NAD(P)-dependent dehydrogenase (short-subunit alcohol dehydrogenase family)